MARPLGRLEERATIAATFPCVSAVSDVWG